MCTVDTMSLKKLRNKTDIKEMLQISWEPNTKAETEMIESVERELEENFFFYWNLEIVLQPRIMDYKEVQWKYNQIASWLKKKTKVTSVSLQILY